MENDAVAPPSRNQRLDTPAMSPAAAEAPPKRTTTTLVSCFKKGSSSSSSAAEAGEEEGRKKKRAGFEEYVTVTECPHFSDYTKREHKSYWISRREMARSREEHRDVLDALLRRSSSSSSSSSGHRDASSPPPPQDEDDYGDEGRFCVRGLEQKTPTGSRRRERNRLVGRQAVEREQYRQWDQGFKDPQSLADEYRLATQHCLRSAVQSAREDRQAVLRQREYYEMDGLSLTMIPPSRGVGGDPSEEDPPPSSPSPSASHPPPRFGGNAKHFAAAAAATAAGGLRPLRKQGRIGISRVA